MKIISIPPTYLYICIGFETLSYFLFPNLNLIGYPLNLIGVLIFILGFYIMMKTWSLFQKHNTTEKFKKSNKLITEGIFKYSRNPMYIGMLLMLIGLVFFLKANLLSFIFPIFFFSIMNFMFIPYEESKNTKTFGKEFLYYKKKTRKWI